MSVDKMTRLDFVNEIPDYNIIVDKMSLDEMSVDKMSFE